MPDRVVLVLHWWYVPVLVILVGLVLAMGPWAVNRESRWDLPSGVGCVGSVLVVVGVAMALGGWLHG